jgi:hypothetical protein
VIGYYIHQRPSPTMFVIAERRCRAPRCRAPHLPMVQASEALRGELTETATT